VAGRCEAGARQDTRQAQGRIQGRLVELPDCTLYWRNRDRAEGVYREIGGPRLYAGHLVRLDMGYSIYRDDRVKAYRVVLKVFIAVDDLISICGMRTEYFLLLSKTLKVSPVDMSPPPKTMKHHQLL
jgi:hypothetical protein